MKIVIVLDNFLWRFFKILLFFGMSCYPCENFLLFILYNFLFLHMVWKRFPTLNSNSIFLRKGGKSRTTKFWNEKLFRMSSYTCEDFQDDIPDILSHFVTHSRSFLFEVDFFLVRLIINEKKNIVCWFFFPRLIFNEKRLFCFCLKLTSFGETYL